VRERCRIGSPARGQRERVGGTRRKKKKKPPSAFFCCYCYLVVCVLLCLCVHVWCGRRDKSADSAEGVRDRECVSMKILFFLLTRTLLLGEEEEGGGAAHHEWWSTRLSTRLAPLHLFLFHTHTLSLSETLLYLPLLLLCCTCTAPVVGNVSQHVIRRCVPAQPPLLQPTAKWLARMEMARSLTPLHCCAVTTHTHVQRTHAR
jgi:hypothetical protein